MEIKSLGISPKKNDGTFDLTLNTFDSNSDSLLTALPYTIQKGEEMRIDLISETLYRDIDDIDILCNINNIDNPLNFKEGEIIVYPSKDAIDNLRFNDPALTDEEDITQVPSKQTRKDPNRKQYIDNNRKLPPNQLPEKLDPINLDSNQIIIGGGLFNT